MVTTAPNGLRDRGRPPTPGHETFLQSSPLQSSPGPTARESLSISTSDDDHMAVRQSCSGMSVLEGNG